MSFIQFPLCCLRCETVELVALPESDEQVTFYECPRCRRHFAQQFGRELCDRWLSPLSLVLYGVIFESRPQAASQRVAELFLAQKTREEVIWMMEEIAQELQKPTQNVCDILDLRQKEEDVRAFLQLVIDYWEAALKSRSAIDEDRA